MVLNQHIASSAQDPLRYSRFRSSDWVSIVSIAASAVIAFLPVPVYANCTTVANTTTCDTTAPSPWTSTIGTGPRNAANATVNIGPNAQVSVGDATAIALSDNSSITLSSGALVENSATSNNGLYATGSNTIDFRNNSTLTVQQNATVLESGTETHAEAINPVGSGNTITNNGTIRSSNVNSEGIWFEDPSGLNTVINNGTIEAPNDAIGASGNGAVDFTNRGKVIGDLEFAGGNDSLSLYTGSSIAGNVNGGGGTNTITLNGTGTASLTGTIQNFQTLYKQDNGTWTLTGSIVGATVAEVEQGTLALDGDDAQDTGSVTVDAPGTLQAPAQSLPPTVTDNGLVQFTQNVDGTYTGLITGTGALEKDDAGTLTLAPAAAGGNTYTGGTVLTQGVLSAPADNVLGAATGGVTFNGGTLQFGDSFDLAGTRPISIESGGGTIDTQDFQSTIAQNITGAGALTKTGTGTLVLDGANTYSGGTTVSEGTLGVGDAASPDAALGGGGPVTVDAGTTLGGYGSVTGNVTNNGTIGVANALPEFAGDANGDFTIHGNVVNANLAQIAGSNGVGNTLTVAGNYIGQNARAALNTQLGADNSLSDRIVISGGQASGTTTLDINNVGGAGGLTVANGIPVVQAVNGGTTTAGAFAQGDSLSAGAYTYVLYHGGVTAGTQNNWYLRSSLPPSTTPTSTPTSPGTTPTSSPILAVGAPIRPTTSPSSTSLEPIYRMEVPIYTEIPSLAREMGVQEIGTFHDRQGSQNLLSENGTLTAGWGWGRVWGDHTVQSNNGGVNQEFDGTIVGAQVGQDVYADTSASGYRNHYGFFLGFAHASGDVTGFALAQPDYAAGNLSINSYSLGGYWTRISPGGWYTDAVLMGSTMTINPLSNQNIGATTHGNALTASIESGLPIPLPWWNLSIEPQAQLIYQDMHINDLNDSVSTVAFHNASGLVGRLGARLSGAFTAAGMQWQPYVRANVLRYFGGTDEATFAGTTVIPTSVSSTQGQVGAGVSARINNTVSIYATAGYWFNLGGAHQRTIEGDAGVRWRW